MSIPSFRQSVQKVQQMRDVREVREVIARCGTDALPPSEFPIGGVAHRRPLFLVTA